GSAQARHDADDRPSRARTGDRRRLAAADVGYPGAAEMRAGPRCGLRGDLWRMARLHGRRSKDHAAGEGDLMNTPLRSGIFLAPFHPKADNPTLAMERDFELLQHLDRLNYSEAWIGEHHSGGVEIIAAPEMFIAAAAERTRHIRLGTGVSWLADPKPFLVSSAIFPP